MSVDVLDAIDRRGVTISRNLELGRRWESVVRSGPLGPIGWECSHSDARLGALLVGLTLLLLGFAC